MVTIPLLLLILRLAAPSIRSLSEHTRLSQCLFAIIPAAGYGFDYVTRIYTDLFASGSSVAMEFMPFLCSVLYLVFVLRVSAEERKRLWMEQKQNILSVQMEQAVCEIDTMRRAGETMRIYRHDMRHHLQYLLSCIENGKLTQAAEHIRQLDAELETGKVPWMFRQTFRRLSYCPRTISVFCSLMPWKMPCSHVYGKRKMEDLRVLRYPHIARMKNYFCRS